MVALGAIGRIAAARYHVAGVTVVAGIAVVTGVVVTVAVVIIIGVVVATVAITQRATGRYSASKSDSPAITVVPVVIAVMSALMRKLSADAPSEISAAH